MQPPKIKNNLSSFEVPLEEEPAPAEVENLDVDQLVGEWEHLENLENYFGNH